MLQQQLEQDLLDDLGVQPALYTHGETLTRVFINHAQHAEDLSIMWAVLNDVIRPGMVLVLRPVPDAGDEIAISKKEGRWFQVIYRDPLANQLTQGWVYGTLVIHLN